jgi:AcrR family transcriptional regulator
VDRPIRDEILTIGQRLFIQHGYHGLSMRAIAEEIGVSKAALYYHFEDKQALFLAILRKSLDEIEVILNHCIESGLTAEAQVRQFVQQILAQPAEQRAVIRLASQELGQLQPSQREAFEADYRQRFLNKINRIFEQGIEQGELRPLDTRLLTWSLLGLLYPYFYPHQARVYPVDSWLADQLSGIFFEGVRRSSACA